MFNWFTNRRRNKIIQAPFPSVWEDIIRRNVAHYCMLEDAERAHLRALIQVFIAEKHWEGAGGLELTDEIRVTISAQACLLLLGLPHDYYRNVESIIVYPSTVVPPQRRLGFFENTFAPVELEHPIIGQAFQQGPIIIIWDAALLGGRQPESGHNVIYHELPTNWTCSMARPMGHLHYATGTNIVTGSRHVRVNTCVSNTTPKRGRNRSSMPTARQTKRNFSPSPPSSSSISRG